MVMWSFIAGMVCGAAILILLILVSDRSFLDLLAGRFAASDDGDSAKSAESLKLQKQKRLAVGNES
jgi:hypothetical protein